MPGGGQFGRDYPNRIDYGRHVDPLSMVDNHAHGHPIEGAYSFRNPSDAKPYGRPLDQRPLGNPSDSRHYGHSSLTEQMPFGSSFESMPYSGSFVDMRPIGGYQECPQKCDLKAWPRCQCLSPATYSDDGRGNCNVGAMNIDLQVRGMHFNPTDATRVAGSPRLGVGPRFDSQGSVIFFNKYCFPNLY